MSELHKAVIDSAGETAVIQKIIEELTELSLALQHRKKIPEHEVLEEIADVTIMLGYFEHIYDPVDLEWWYKVKYERLQQRLEDNNLMEGMV